MIIITKKVNEPCEIKTMDTLELKDMQAMVGGYIECLHVGNGVDMWLNDEGKLYGLPVNLVLGSPEREILDTIQGDVFFASCDDEGTTIGLTDEQVNWVKQKLDSGHFATAQTEHGLEFVPVWVYAPMAS